MRVLVIDDSRAMRMILKNALVSLGHEVAEAGNGQEALERVKAAGPFGLALVDWNMPVLNGLEFVRAVRKDPANADMKMMMVTTEMETDQVVKALEAGANEYVMKPFTDDILKEKLAMVMES
ncbi:MAG TPA: response regulator [Tepidisphaeraceae bacterium]|nr:response regulator [Tepidisphaeraceae bacterium]